MIPVDVGVGGGKGKGRAPVYLHPSDKVLIIVNT